MYCLHLVLVLLITLQASTSEKGSTKVKNCGHHFLNTSSKYKSFGGRQLKVNEYPWIAAIRWNLTYLGRRRDDVKCSGVLISPKHVLTAAHCVVLIDNYRYALAAATISKVRPLEGDCSKYRKKRIVPRPDMFSVLVGSQCIDPRNCSIKPVELAKVHFREDFGDCSGDNDLALLELRDDISDQVATPICMPTRATKLSRILQVAGAGMTAAPMRGIKRTQLFNGFQTVNVSFIKLVDNTIATAMPPGAGICGGDSGGPLFQSDSNGVNTLVGIISSGESCYNNYNESVPPGESWNPCDSYNKNITDFSTDVRVFLNWICDKSGICPEENDNKVELYEKEHSIDFCGEAQEPTPEEPAARTSVLPEQMIKKPMPSAANSPLYFSCASSLGFVFIAYLFRI